MDFMLASTTLCQNDVSQLIDAIGDNFPIVVIFGLGVPVAIIAILFGSLTSISKTKEHERTKRELAAYVAEGSMTPADAEKILKSNPDKPEW